MDRVYEDVRKRCVMGSHRERCSRLESFSSRHSTGELKNITGFVWTRKFVSDKKPSVWTGLTTGPIQHKDVSDQSNNHEIIFIKQTDSKTSVQFSVHVKSIEIPPIRLLATLADASHVFREILIEIDLTSGEVDSAFLDITGYLLCLLASDLHTGHWKASEL